MDILSCSTWSLTMDLKTLDSTFLADLHLPAEALAALATGTEWEATPDTVEFGIEFAEWCDDCDTWHKTWSVYGLRLDPDGTLWTTRHEVDTDGNWDFADEIPYTPDDAEYMRASEEADRSWEDYARYVVREGGRDPLGNYGWGGSRQVQERWSFAVGEDLRVAEVRRGRGAWLPVGEAPARVRGFLNLDTENRTDGFGSLAELREKAHGLRWGRTRDGFARAHFALSVERPRSDAAVRADKVRAAKRQLAETAKRRAEGADAG